MIRSVLALAIFALAACSPPDGQEGYGTPQSQVIHAEIVTSAGVIGLELYPDAAPVSVANFVEHAQAGHYDGGSFYRAVRPDNDRPGVEPMHLIQGGYGFDGLPGAAGIAHEATEETGLSHVRGAISMARFDPGTATTEFFIMADDYPGLDSGPGRRNPDEAGYAVFGQVTSGMEVVGAIAAQETGLDDAPEDFQYPQFIVEPVRIESVRVVDADAWGQQ
ncbi:peptidylprolyl isomerase [Glycocaulis abyssi]|uniref:peptidylprolyl isomerase n=1 Tax=Glycocaulis abyssi TaxID=1433403 RepID=A0ABV9NDM3_9PROT